jgi:hypothetical protein
MRVETFKNIDGMRDFERLQDFIRLLHRLRIIRVVSCNPGYFAKKNDAANSIGSPLDPVNPEEMYVRLIYEKSNVKQSSR